jgi:hypothetical protein
MIRSKTGLVTKRSIAVLCWLLGMVLLFSGCGRLRGRLAGDAAPSAAPVRTQAVTPPLSAAPAQAASPELTAAPQEEVTPDAAQNETLSNVIDDLNGMQDALQDLDEPLDTDLLVP